MKKLFLCSLITLTAVGMQDNQSVDFEKHDQVSTQVQKLYLEIKKERSSVKSPRKSRIKVIALKGNQNKNVALVAAFTKAINGTENLKTEWRKTPTGECDRQVRVVYIKGYCWVKANKCKLALLKQQAEANGSLREGTKKYTKSRKPKSILKWPSTFFDGHIEQERCTVKCHSIPFDAVIFHLFSSTSLGCPHGNYD